MVGELLQAAGKGNTDLHKVVVQGRDIRDAQPSNEAELQAAIKSMIPIPGGSQDAGGQLVRDLLVEFLKGFSTYPAILGYGPPPVGCISCGETLTAFAALGQCRAHAATIERTAWHQHAPYISI